MSRQVLEMFRRGHDAFSRGDPAAVREAVTEDVYWVRDGRVARRAAFFEKSEALEAADLPDV